VLLSVSSTTPVQKAATGKSRRDDALDTVIALRRLTDYSPEEGARFRFISKRPA
jgi:hypothetical protein